MSTTDTESHDCAVCENKTKLRCDACREVYFCSKECQTMIWSTHKWTCGKLSLPFTFPPLTPLEIAEIERLQDAPFTRSPITAGPLTLLGELHEGGLFRGSWEELLHILAALPSPSMPTVRNFLLAVSHDFLEYCSDGSVPLSPWRQCGLLVAKSFVSGYDISRTLKQITPFLHQGLIHGAIVLRLDKLPPQKLTLRRLNDLFRSNSRAAALLSKGDIDEGPAAALRSFWDEEAKVVNEELRKTTSRVEAERKGNM